MSFLRQPLLTVALPACALLLGAPSALAQFNNDWLEFVPDAAQPDLIGLSSTSIEVDFAFGDLDGDGYIDVAVARKQPVTSTGKRTNVLLMNEQGTLTDRTALYASASDVPGDLGFSTPTNDSDIALVDVNADGNLDVVTAVRLSAADPKHIGHPRVYLNLGGSGTWNGLEHQDSRIPQLFKLGGAPGNPNFTTVAAGDLDADGDTDLYFGDATGGGMVNDYGDRLLANDGLGFFTDATMGALTTAQANNTFTTHVDVADLNLDGFDDIVQDGGFNAGIYAMYNPPATPGSGFGKVAIDTSSAYNFDLGDLNNDGRLDVVISSNGNDGFRINQSTSPSGTVNWSAKQTFTFLQGSDDGFGGQSQIVDFDLDGFNDALLCDVDADLSGFNRRAHLYHNQGSPVGGTPAMVEEREQSTAGGWMGAVGLLTADLKGSFDVAAFDVDNDGDADMLLGTSTNTVLWTNQTNKCQVDLGFGGPGSLTLSVCGPPLSSGNSTPLKLAGGPPSAPGVMLYSASANPIPLFGGLVVPIPIAGSVNITLDASGQRTLPINGGLLPAGQVRVVQVGVIDVVQVGLVQLSNAVQVTFE